MYDFEVVWSRQSVCTAAGIRIDVSAMIRTEENRSIVLRQYPVENCRQIVERGDVVAHGL